MDNFMKINEEISVATFEPDTESFELFSQQGFQSVINLQTADEEQKISEEQEERLANENNFHYVQIGVSKNDLNSKTMDEFRQKLRSAPKPVVVHCKSGKRSGAFVMMHLGSEQGLTGEEVLQQAKEMGFECDVPELENFLKQYVNENRNE